MDKGIYNPFTFVCAAGRLESPPLMVKILKVMGAALRFSSCSSEHSCIKMYLLFPKKSQIGLNGKLLRPMIVKMKNLFSLDSSSDSICLDLTPLKGFLS